MTFRQSRMYLSGCNKCWEMGQLAVMFDVETSSWESLGLGKVASIRRGRNYMHLGRHLMDKGVIWAWCCGSWVDIVVMRVVHVLKGHCTFGVSWWDTCIWNRKNNPWIYFTIFGVRMYVFLYWLLCMYLMLLSSHVFYIQFCITYVIGVSNTITYFFVL